MAKTLSKIDPNLVPSIRNIRLYAHYLQLKKFLPNLSGDKQGVSQINSGTKNSISRNIVTYQMWLQGETSMPALVKKCLATVRGFSDQYVLLTSSNVLQNTDLPGYVFDKWRAGKISSALFSDIVRADIASRGSARWVDATVFQTGELWPEMREGFFAFRTNTVHQLGSPVIKMANWYLNAEDEWYTMKLTRDTLLNFWRSRNSEMNYYQFHLIYSLVTDLFLKANKEHESISFLSEVPPTYLLRELYIPVTDTRYSRILDSSPIHKLSYYGVPIQKCKNSPAERLGLLDES